MNRKEIAREDLDIKGEIKTHFEWAARRIFLDAIKGKPTAQREILDKCLGKNFKIDFVSKDGIKVIIEYVAKEKDDSPG